jgi:hypothetical protein
MLKYLSIFATLVALGTGSASAQQREAIFQKIKVPNASFNIVLATAKPDSATLYYQDQPDPNIIDLGNGLVTAYTAELAEMLDITTLMRPARSIVALRGDKKGETPVIVYFVPKHAATTAAAAPSH